MELSEIKRQALADREFTHTVGAVTFTLRLPTMFENQVAARVCDRGDDDQAFALRMERHLLHQGVVGWAGARIKDVLPKHPNDDPLPFEVDAVPVLLDAQPIWTEALSLDFFGRMADARAILEAAQKN